MSNQICNSWFLFLIIVLIPTTSMFLLSLLIQQANLSYYLVYVASLYLLMSIWLYDFAMTKCNQKRTEIIREKA